MNPMEFHMTPSESASINEFLNTPTGRKWIAVLLMRKPKIDVTTTERAALTGAVAAGYESVFAEIHMTRSAPTAPDSASIKSIDPTKD